MKASRKVERARERVAESLEMLETLHRHQRLTLEVLLRTAPVMKAYLVAVDQAAARQDEKSAEYLGERKAVLARFGKLSEAVGLGEVWGETMREE